MNKVLKNIKNLRPELVFRSFHADFLHFAVISSLLFFGYLSFSCVQNMTHSYWWISHTSDVLNKAEEMLGSTVDIETATRGYLLTKEDHFLEPYFSGKQTFEILYAELMDLTHDNHRQQKRLRELNKLYSDRLYVLDSQIRDLRRDFYNFDFQDHRLDQGKAIQDQIRILIDEIKREEQQLLKVRAALADKASQNAVNVIECGGIFISFLWFLFLITYKKKLKSLHELASVNSHAKRMTRTISEIYENSDSVIGIVTLQGKMLEISKVCERIWGYTQDEMKLQPLPTIFHPEDMELTRVASALIIKNGTTHSFVNRTFTKTGEVKKVSWNVTLMKEEDCFFFVATDITENDQTQQALKNTKHLLDIASELALFGGWKINLSDMHVEWTNQVHQILELPDKEAIPLDTGISMYLPESRSRIEAAINLCAESGKEILEIADIRTAKGNIKKVKVFGRLINDNYIDQKAIFGTIQDITDQSQTLSKLDSLYHYDQLTGLANRRKFLKDIADVLNDKSKHFVLTLDIDNFKLINQKYGVRFGDEVIKRMSSIVLGAAGESKLASRLGADEFALVLSLCQNLDTAKEMIKSFSKELLALCSDTMVIQDELLHVTVSIGIERVILNDLDQEEFLRKAEIAKQYAKRAGKNTFKFYDPETMGSSDSIELRHSLFEAISNKQIIAEFQPQVHINGELLGAEVLARWTTVQGQSISPLVFIPLAENSGLIRQLGDAVIEYALSIYKPMKDKFNLNHFKLSINISLYQFSEEDFVDRLIRFVKLFEVPFEDIRLELTESIFAENMQEISEKMQKLKSLGCSFSIDDFGTGYSSLSYLKNLPIDELKIDRSFVKDISTDEEAKSIAGAIVTLAKSLGREVIAEGVETKEQVEILSQMGCDNYQGYYFSKPLSVDSLKYYLEINRFKSTSSDIN